MTGWTLRRADASEKRINVPKRTEAQRERSKRNVEHPPAPEPSLRRARPDR